MISNQKDLVKEFQRALNDKGAGLSVDGDFGELTARAASRFDTVIALKAKTVNPSDPVKGLRVIDWARGELGQKEVLGANDNPRIRWYHTHSANIGSKEHADEVAWCSSFLNAGADECGFKKTDNALASSWKDYGSDTGDEVEEGDVIVLPGHVTLANRAFNRKSDKTFEGLGGNQSNSVKVSSYSVADIVAARKWVKV